MTSPSEMPLHTVVPLSHQGIIKRRLQEMDFEEDAEDPPSSMLGSQAVVVEEDPTFIQGGQEVRETMIEIEEVQRLHLQDIFPVIVAS